MNRQIFFLRETKRVVSLILNQNSEKIAQVRFSPPCYQSSLPRTAYLHNINVEPKYRNENIGSTLLKNMNRYLKENTHANKITGVLWDDTTNPFLSSFFEKNGYSLKKDEFEIYDDGEIMVEITPIERNL